MVNTRKKSVICCLIIVVSLFSSVYGFVQGTHGLVIITEYGSNESYEKTLNARATDQNHPVGLGATSKMFLTALYQEAAPILVPAPLMRTVLDHTARARDVLQGSADSLYQAYCLNKRYKDPRETHSLHAYATYLNSLYQGIERQAHAAYSATVFEQTLWNDSLFDAASAPALFDDTSATWHEAIAYVMCYYAPWHKYEIRSIRHGDYYFYLCLPKRLLDYTVSERYALKTVLQYERLPLIQDIVHYAVPCSVERDEAVRQYGYDEALYTVLRQLLVPKTGTSSDPVWTFYCMGHGSFCYDACDKMCEQLHNRTQCLHEKAQFDAEAQRWENESLVWKQKQHTDRMYDPHHHAYVIYDQNAVRHNIDACERNVQVCKHNQTVCDQNCATIDHNMMCIACANTVAGVSQSWFKKILQLFDTYVKTNLVFYRSCSAGGQQMVETYTDDNNQPIRLSYTVVVGALCEAASSTYSPLFHLTWFRQRSRNLFIRVPFEKLIDKQRRTVALDSRYNLNAFFEQAQRVQGCDMQILIESVNPVIRSAIKPVLDNGSWYDGVKDGVDVPVKKVCGSDERKDTEREDISNVPSIRFPYETEFHVIDMHNTIIPLTTKDLAADSASSFCIRSPYEIILLYARNVSKPLTVPMREHGLFPAVVSMVPGATYHVLEKIEAASYNLSSIFSSFFTCTTLKAPKAMVIKAITGINDMINQVAYGFPQTVTNVYVFNYCALNKAGVTTMHEYVNGVMFDTQYRSYLMTWSYDELFPQTYTLQTINGYQQKNIADVIVKQASPKNHDSYYEPSVPVMIMRDIEKKM